MCDLHNKVNASLKKPIFDCKKAFDFWGGDCGCDAKKKDKGTAENKDKPVDVIVKADENKSKVDEVSEKPGEEVKPVEAPKDKVVEVSMKVDSTEKVEEHSRSENSEKIEKTEESKIAIKIEKPDK